MGWFSIVTIVVLACISIVVSICYCLTLHRALSRCSPQNRAMSPRLVWLVLIPIFGLGWQFVVVVNLAKSLHTEFVYRNMAAPANPGMHLGLAMCTLELVGLASRSAPDSLALGIILIVLGGASFICWIVYWVKIASYSDYIALPYRPAEPPAGVTV
jgi:hypothetical protein